MQINVIQNEKIMQKRRQRMSIQMKTRKYVSILKIKRNKWKMKTKC